MYRVLGPPGPGRAASYCVGAPASQYSHVRPPQPLPDFSRGAGGTGGRAARPGPARPSGACAPEGLPPPHLGPQVSPE